MFRRGQYLLTFLLTAVYVGQSLFLGALHYHNHGHSNCYVHEHAGLVHEHAGHVCESASEPSVPSKVSIHSTHHHGQSSPDSHSNCVICQHLAQGALAEDPASEMALEQVAVLLATLESCFVQLRPFSLPQPRSPPVA